MTTSNIMKLWFTNQEKVIKIRFEGEDLYDLKQAIQTELGVNDVEIKPCNDIDPFSEDTLISELLDMFPNTYEKRWLLHVNTIPTNSTFTFEFPSFSYPFKNRLRTDYTLEDVQGWMGNQEWTSIEQDFKKVKLLTMIYMFQQLLYFRGFSLFSVTSLLLAGNIYGYWYGKRNQVNFNHTAIRQKDHISFIKSCFVHSEINQLMLNLSSLVVMLPLVEQRIGWAHALIAYVLGCYFYKKAMTKEKNQNSLGATGAVLALSASRMRFTVPSLLERSLYFFAMNESFKATPHLLIMFLGYVGL
jgi:membrane associated rhomboid family serine protease